MHRFTDLTRCGIVVADPVTWRPNVVAVKSTAVDDRVSMGCPCRERDVRDRLTSDQQRGDIRMNSSRKLNLGIVQWFDNEYDRRVLAGVLDYAHAHSFAKVRVIHTSRVDSNLAETSDLDGLVIALDRNELGRANVQELPEPKVFVPRLSSKGLPSSVSTDAMAVGRMAAEHFFSLGIRSASIVRRFEVQSFAELSIGFEEVFGRKGGKVFPCPWFASALADCGSEAMDWMRGLPANSGVLCQRDVGALFILETALKCGLRVPEDLAVLGVGNDRIDCMLAMPKLSSIDTPCERMGWLAAEMLVKKCEGEEVQPIQLPPLSVVQRDSTATLAIKDELVAKAVRFIRRYAEEGVGVDEVVDEVGVTRSTLYRRFESAMGCGIHEEIVRLRLAKAMLLLSTGTEPIKNVARSVGFGNLANFTRFMRQHTGLSARKYREKNGIVVS